MLRMFAHLTSSWVLGLNQKLFGGNHPFSFLRLNVWNYVAPKIFCWQKNEGGNTGSLVTTPPFTFFLYLDWRESCQKSLQFTVALRWGLSREKHQAAAGFLF